MPLTHPPGHAQLISAKRGRSSPGSGRRCISSPLTCRKAMRRTFGRTERRRLSVGRRARARVLVLRRVALSIVYDNDRCLVSRIERDGTRRRTRLFSGFSRTTSSGTGTGARARAMTRAQWRAWWAGHGATSWCRCRALRASRRSTCIWNSAAASDRATCCAASREHREAPGARPRGDDRTAGRAVRCLSSSRGPGELAVLGALPQQRLLRPRRLRGIGRCGCAATSTEW